MEEIKIINLIVTAVIVILIVYDGIQINNFKNKIDALSKDIETIKTKAQDYSYRFTKIDNDLAYDQMQIVDLWIKTLELNNYVKIQTWEKENSNFINCDKGDTDIMVARAHYTDTGTPAQKLVYMFHKGDLIYENSGDVYCYLKPISKLNPPHADCDMLCLNENETNEQVQNQ